MVVRLGMFACALFLSTAVVLGADGAGEKGGGKAEQKEQPKPQVDKGNGGKGDIGKPAQSLDEQYRRLMMGPNGLPMPADRTRSAAAKQVLEETKAELSKALAGAGGASNAGIENALWNTPAYRTAAYDLRRSQSDYDRVRKPIFDALRTDSYYRDLERKRNDSEKLLANLALTGRGTFDWLFPQAMVAMDIRNRLTREQIMAMALSPDVEDARQEMLLAAARLRSMRAAYITQQGGAESFRSARATLDAARDQVKKAISDYNAARAEEADYERLRSDYIAGVRRGDIRPGERVGSGK